MPWDQNRLQFTEKLTHLAGRCVAAVALEGGKRRPLGWLREVVCLGMVEELEIAVECVFKG